METELKLRFVQEDGQANFLADPWANQLVMPDSRTVTQMRSRYFDSEGLTLTHLKTSLRVRQEGDMQVATIKMGDQSRDGLHQRMEWSVRLAPGEWPEERQASLDAGWFEKNAVSDGDPDDLLHDILLQVEGQSLQEICQARFVRTAFDVGYGDTLMELAIDDGLLCAGDLTAPINEMELELKEGDVRDLVALGQELQARFELVPETQSKYARCLELLRQTRSIDA
jgi:triphosphatase